MQAIIFFTLAISAMIFVIYLGARSTMRGMKAKSERLTEEEELKNLPENNTGMISELEKLNELGIDENTMVIFTSDNGPWFEGSSGQFRNRKGTSWEGGLRVPFIARWPSIIPRNQRNSHAAMNIDVLPTILDFAGVSLPSETPPDGKSLRGVLTNGEGSPHD